MCEKLSQTGVTSYNDIANLLVEESRLAEVELVDFLILSVLILLVQGGKAVLKIYDEKNIRRRIYDALNVLMAMVQRRSIFSVHTVVACCIGHHIQG